MVRWREIAKYSRLSLEERRGAFLAEIRDKYPDLSVRQVEGHLVIRGSFPVVHEAKALDRYLVEIILPDDFPNSEPAVREVGGRIPHNRDNHVNPQDGTICWRVPEEWLLEEDRSLRSFLDKDLHNFFLAYSLSEVGYPLPFGDRYHGSAGLIQSYEEILGVKGSDAILRFLDCLSREQPRRHKVCPCGSGRHLNQCHLDFVTKLRERIPAVVARKAAQRLRAALESTRALEEKWTAR